MNAEFKVLIRIQGKSLIIIIKIGLVTRSLMIVNHNDAHKLNPTFNIEAIILPFCWFEQEFYKQLQQSFRKLLQTMVHLAIDLATYLLLGPRDMLFNMKTPI